MKKTLLILFIALFFLACLVPVVGLCVAGPGAPAANEAQVFAPQLKNWDGSFNENYLRDLSNFVSKGFWLRLECITGWNRLCAETLGSTVSEDVILGEDDWLFYYTAVDEVSGLSLLTDRQIWCCARNLYLMQDYAEQQGADFLFAAPNGKYDLYSEYMRDYAVVQEGRNIDRLQALLDDMGVRYSDMYSLFTQQDEVLYWRGDSHWNGKGAALAADDILAALGDEDRFFAGEFIETEPHLGDLYVMLYPTGSEREPEYIPAEGFDFVYESEFRTENDLNIRTSNAAETGALLMFRDSFGRNLYPYMAQAFGTAEFSRLNNYQLYQIPQKGITDVVIELGVKNLYYLLRYPAVYPSPERDAALLDGMVPAVCEPAVEPDSEIEGYAKISGEIGPTAVDSPVLLRIGSRVYEAMPGDGSFTAYVDSSMDLNSIEVFIVE